MAIIDDLVTSGLSVTQAQAVIDEDAGTGSVAALVAQGFSGVQASTIDAGSPSAADLVSAGFSTPQQLAITAALAVTP
jgi:orotate phosphoribosyltransferase